MWHVKSFAESRKISSLYRVRTYVLRGCSVVVSCYSHAIAMPITCARLFLVGPKRNDARTLSHGKRAMQVITVVTEMKRVAVRIAKAVKERRDKLVAARICLVCEEPIGDKPSRRGECPSCRAFTSRNVERGIVTETDLIRDGQLLEQPEQPRGGQSIHPKRQALLNRSKKN